MDLDSLFNGFGFGLGFENSNGGPPLSLPLVHYKLMLVVVVVITLPPLPTGRHRPRHTAGRPRHRRTAGRPRTLCTDRMFVRKLRPAAFGLKRFPPSILSVGYPFPCDDYHVGQTVSPGRRFLTNIRSVHRVRGRPVERLGRGRPAVRLGRCRLAISECPSFCLLWVDQS